MWVITVLLKKFGLKMIYIAIVFTGRSTKLKREECSSWENNPNRSYSRSSQCSHLNEAPQQGL